MKVLPVATGIAVALLAGATAGTTIRACGGTAEQGGGAAPAGCRESVYEADGAVSLQCDEGARLVLDDGHFYCRCGLSSAGQTDGG